MQKLFTLGAALALAASLACGKSDAEKQAEQAAAEAAKAAEAASKAVESASKAAGQDMAKGMEDFAKAMAGLAGAAGGDGKLVEPVAFQTLQTTLPEVSGWEMEKPTGERMTSPVPFAEAASSYANGDARVEVKVVDSGFAPLLIAPWSMMLASGYSRETSEGYEKAVTVKGQPAFEKWNSERKDGELNILVEKRFLVTIDGNDIDSTKTLHDFVSKMDFGKLAGLK